MTAKKKSNDAAKKKVKKAASVRVRSIRDIDRFFSHKDTPPINELTEDQLIREGIHPPFQYKNAVVAYKDGTRQVGRFEKQKHEVETLKMLKKACTEPAPRGGVVTIGDVEVVDKLTIHVKNHKRVKEFTTTRTFHVKPSEVNGIVGRYDTTKYYYGGRVTHVN